MSEVTKKLIGFLVFALIAGGISLTYARVLRDEADKFGGGDHGAAMIMCLDRHKDRLPSRAAGESACSCAVTEIERRGFDYRNLETGGNAEVEAIVDSCVTMAS